MNNKLIKKLNKKQIRQILKDRKLENIPLIEKIEKIFIQKRGYVSKIPQQKSPVILILSGGLDSVIVWGYLMAVYRLKVYPLFLFRGQRRAKKEAKAADFFYKYYKKKFGELCQPIKKMTAYIPPMEIRFPITINSNKIKSKNGRWMGIPMYSNILSAYAVQYAYYLQITKKIKIRTIFAGFMATDGLVMKDETLTAMRINNLSVAELTEDFSWQIIALPIEKELGFFYGKETFIKWADTKKIPIEKTRSCMMWGKYHCDRCVSCKTRKIGFKKAGIQDKTIYGESRMERIRRKTKKFFKKNTPTHENIKRKKSKQKNKKKNHN